MRAESVHRREENRLFSQDLLGPLGIGAESEERPHRLSAPELGGRTCRRRGERRSEACLPALLAYLLLSGLAGKFLEKTCWGWSEDIRISREAGWRSV